MSNIDLESKIPNNVGLSSDLFKLDVPAGVEIVDVGGSYGP